jgi:hypothetical protein
MRHYKIAGALNAEGITPGRGEKRRGLSVSEIVTAGAISGRKA